MEESGQIYDPAALPPWERAPGMHRIAGNFLLYILKYILSAQKTSNAQFVDIIHVC
jgi:hypothetical protein